MPPEIILQPIGKSEDGTEAFGLPKPKSRLAKIGDAIAIQLRAYVIGFFALWIVMSLLSEMGSWAVWAGIIALWIGKEIALS